MQSISNFDEEDAMRPHDVKPIVILKQTSDGQTNFTEDDFKVLLVGDHKKRQELMQCYTNYAKSNTRKIIHNLEKIKLS